MSELIDNTEARRFEMDFAASGDHAAGRVWGDYAVRGDVRAIMHVEAEPQLRGSGAAARFMQALAEHARRTGLKMRPLCGYAAAWHRRHPEFDDTLV